MMILRSGMCVKLRADHPIWVVVVLLGRHKEWWTCKVIQDPVGSAVGDGISVHADDLRAGLEIVNFATTEPEQRNTPARVWVEQEPGQEIVNFVEAIPTDHLFDMFATVGWSGDAPAIGLDEFRKVIEAICEQRMP